MDNFYLTLPSNVKSTLFDNKVANFKTKLAYRLELQNDWEVGLSSISYTYSWMNIPNSEIIKFKYFANGQVHYICKPVILKNGLYPSIEKVIAEINKRILALQNKENTLEGKRYRYIKENPSEFITNTNIQNLGDETILNELKKEYSEIFKPEIWSKQSSDEKWKMLEDVSTKIDTEQKKIDNEKKVIEKLKLENLTEIKLPEFFENQYGKKVQFKMTKYLGGHVFPEMSPELCRILGYDYKYDKHREIILRKMNKDYNSLNDEGKKTYKSTIDENIDVANIYGSQMPELYSTIHSLFVYCDVVKPSFVGDSLTQLIRCVEIPSSAKYGEQVVITYPNTHYYTVNSRDIESIEIDITDDIGKRIPFLFGRTICTLHFRKKK